MSEEKEPQASTPVQKPDPHDREHWTPEQRRASRFVYFGGELEIITPPPGKKPKS